MAVQYCGTCGQPLIPGQLFCQHCGSRADENATYGAFVDENATRAAVLPGAASSPSSVGTLYCGQCGALVNSQERACRRCGAPVEFAPGLTSNPSLTDAPTMRSNTPIPQAGAQTPPPTRTYAGPGPGYTPRQPQGWAAEPGTAAVQPPGWASAPAYGPQASRPDEAPTFATNFRYAGTPPPQAGRGAVAPGQRTPPYAPSGRPPRQSGSRWPLVLAVVLVALALIVGGSLFLLLRGSSNNGQTAGQTATSAPGITPTATTPPVTPSPTQVVLNTTTAEALIQQFYDDINAQQYDAAYNLLSPEYQQKQSRQNFKDGFATTVMDTVMIQNAQALSDGTVQVNVTLQAVDQKSGMQVTTCYGGNYIVELINGQLLIKSGKLNQQSC